MEINYQLDVGNRFSLHARDLPEGRNKFLEQKHLYDRNKAEQIGSLIEITQPILFFNNLINIRSISLNMCV